MEKRLSPLAIVLIVLTLIFVAGKIFNFIDWDWIWVLSPAWGIFALGIVLVFLYWLTGVLLKKREKRKEKKRQREIKKQEKIAKIQHRKAERKEKIQAKKEQSKSNTSAVAAEAPVNNTKESPHKVKTEEKKSLPSRPSHSSVLDELYGAGIHTKYMVERKSTRDGVITEFEMEISDTLGDILAERIGLYPKFGKSWDFRTNNGINHEEVQKNVSTKTEFEKYAKPAMFFYVITVCYKSEQRNDFYVVLSLKKLISRLHEKPKYLFAFDVNLTSEEKSIIDKRIKDYCETHDTSIDLQNEIIILDPVFSQSEEGKYYDEDDVYEDDEAMVSGSDFDDLKFEEPVHFVVEGSMSCITAIDYVTAVNNYQKLHYDSVDDCLDAHRLYEEMIKKLL